MMDQDNNMMDKVATSWVSIPTMSKGCKGQGVQQKDGPGRATTWQTRDVPQAEDYSRKQEYGNKKDEDYMMDDWEE